VKGTPQTSPRLYLLLNLRRNLLFLLLFHERYLGDIKSLFHLVIRQHFKMRDEIIHLLVFLVIYLVRNTQIAAAPAAIWVLRTR
jgi:hypothetical protein